MREAATQAVIPDDMGDETFVSALFKIILYGNPLVDVDYWWTDYDGDGGALLFGCLWDPANSCARVAVAVAVACSDMFLPPLSLPSFPFVS